MPMYTLKCHLTLLNNCVDSIIWIVANPAAIAGGEAANVEPSEPGRMIDMTDARVEMVDKR